jgi:hypothetical protein
MPRHKTLADLPAPDAETTRRLLAALWPATEPVTAAPVEDPAAEDAA